MFTVETRTTLGHKLTTTLLSDAAVTDFVKRMIATDKLRGITVSAPNTALSMGRYMVTACYGQGDDRYSVTREVATNAEAKALLAAFKATCTDHIEVENRLRCTEVYFDRNANGTWTRTEF